MNYTFDDDCFSDIYKNAYGTRPHYHVFYDAETTDDEKQKIWDDLMVANDRANEEFEEARNEAVDSFEKLVVETINLGAGDRATAIRWIIIGSDFSRYDLMYGGEYCCYLFNLPDNIYKEEFNAILAGIDENELEE